RSSVERTRALGRRKGATAQSLARPFDPNCAGGRLQGRVVTDRILERLNAKDAVDAEAKLAASVVRGTERLESNVFQPRFKPANARLDRAQQNVGILRGVQVGGREIGNPVVEQRIVQTGERFGPPQASPPSIQEILQIPSNGLLQLSQHLGCSRRWL